RLGTSLTAAAGAQEAAGKAAARRAGWQAAAVAQPLSDVPQLATDALAASHAQTATKVEGDFPTNANADRSFLARARARRALGGQAAADAAGLEAHALAAQTTWIEATTRSADKLPALRRAFDTSVAALSDFVTATPRVEGAAA